ncbi:putative ABC transporter permease protein [Maritalea myrionectae]|uniref:Maltose/maltodextrin transport system permease protein MalG n=1 Tax=Maritalea myrionectae TaxID=454601 RepID=A0A2R4MH40_9HYPH|nr:carbohydrate ABC transporter permease [Maritalea myrionectae]AVX05377.1 putative ABC transporter permease protein [Maritalea myrionectae]
MINKYRWWEIVGIYLGIAVFLLFLLAPFLEAFLVSMRPLNRINSIPYKIITDNMSFDAYFTMWENVPRLGRYIWNSFFIATCVTLIVLVAVIPAAWAFARFEFKGRDPMLAAFLAINMVGGAVLIIPLFQLMRNLGLLNTYLAMIIPGAAFLIPTAIWLLRSYLMKIPRELEEAAWVDGASRPYILWKVILPIAMPGIVVVAIATFIGAYAQQFLFALTFNSNSDLHPLPVGIYQFFGRQTVIWNEVMAASLVGILPVLIIYIFLQRYIIAGLTAGAVKE